MKLSIKEKRMYGYIPKLDRKIKPGDKMYEPFTDRIVYFWDYTIPEDDMSASYEEFRFKGFDMLPITNSIVQTGKSFDYIKQNP